MSQKNPTKKELCIAWLKYAGYHDDSATLARLLVERPRNLSLDDARRAANAGATMRQNGMKCGCKICNP